MKTMWRSPISVIVVIALLILLLAVRGPVPRNPLSYTPLSQINPHTMVTTRALENDIDAYVALITSMHGDPFRVVTSDVFLAGAGALKDRVRARQADSLPLLDAYYVLQELAATLEDEHTEIVFPPQWNREFGPMFPLRIRILGDRAYVEECLGSDTIPPLAEVVSVGGLRVEEMLEEVSPYQSQTLVHFKRRVIASTFGRWLQAYFGLRQRWSLTYRTDGRLDTVEVRGISPDAYRAAAGQPEAYSASAMTAGDLRVPILEVSSFSPRSTDTYKDFVDSFFAANLDAPYLVVDVRDNPGGSGALGWYILDQMTDAPFERVRRMTYRVSEEYQAYLNWTNRTAYHRKRIPRVLWWLPLYRRMDLYLGENRHRFLRAEIGSRIDARYGTRIREVHTPPYRGTVFVLTSHGTNSAAVVFAAAFKAAGLGLIVGQETGGRETFTSDPVHVELPHTHLRAKVPVALMVLPGNNPDRGVLPDLPVEPTIDDLRRGPDPELEMVREYITAARGS